LEKLTIRDLDGAVLAFDLRDLLRVLSPRSLAATWKITSSSESAFDATGAGGLRLEALATIADDTVQVIWGDFVGALPADPHQEWLIVRAVDSSFFEIETSDQSSIAAIKSRFHDVRIV
jgi:hypothetical protein